LIGKSEGVGSIVPSCEGENFLGRGRERAADDETAGPRREELKGNWTPDIGKGTGGRKGISRARSERGFNLLGDPKDWRGGAGTNQVKHRECTEATWAGEKIEHTDWPLEQVLPRGTPSMISKLRGCEEAQEMGGSERGEQK